MSNHNHYETVGKVIFSVKEQTDAHLLSDDTGFSDEQIYYYLLQCRSLFLYRKYRTYRDVSQKDYMTTPCMNLIDADNQCPCKPPTGCEILMTELYLPNMIGNIISVINPDGTKEYTPTESNLSKYRKDSRIKIFADKTSYFQLSNNKGTKLYIISDKPLKAIKVILIPQYPEEIQRMPDCKGDNINECVATYDLEWILDPDLTKACIDETINILLRTKSKLADVKNNGVDDNIANKQEINV